MCPGSSARVLCANVPWRRYVGTPIELGIGSAKYIAEVPEKSIEFIFAWYGRGEQVGRGVEHSQAAVSVSGRHAGRSDVNPSNQVSPG